jgi:hypothetical protein
VFDRPLPAFDTEAVPAEPSDLFLWWLHEAVDAGVCEPHAMTLSTAKGTQLTASAHAALSFHWREQGRQVRVRGEVAAADPSVSAADLVTRTTDGSAGDADYGAIGHAYTRYRRPDPRIAARIGGRRERYRRGPAVRRLLRRRDDHLQRPPVERPAGRASRDAASAASSASTGSGAA